MTQFNRSGATFEDECNFDLSILLPITTHHNISSHLALDIGGTLIKLVYISKHEDPYNNQKSISYLKHNLGALRGGSLRFVKFETTRINECLDFIHSKQLHCRGIYPQDWSSETQVNGSATIKVTGGGAYKFSNLFKERLGVYVEKEDEMDCLVAGANFLLKAMDNEVFTHIEGEKKFVHIDQNDLFPYLLVNIGSGVSVIKVDGNGKYERVGGTSEGGGTYLGLGRLLTKCKSFDKLLELSQRGDNRKVDMLVGDIYGGRDYAKIGLSASTIASSFGKVIYEQEELEDYRPEDLSLSLLRMISNNIGLLAHSKAREYGLKRIFFGGFFIRGHAYTMDTISFAVRYWSKGDINAMFLRHEGFLGTLGALMGYEEAQSS